MPSVTPWLASAGADMAVRVGARGRVACPHDNVNPHGVDIEAWLLENNLRATGYVRTVERHYDHFS